MSKEHWSEDGMIYYDEWDEGWAVLNDGSTVCLCSEADVNKVLSGEVGLDTVTNPKQREALEIIINYRKEQSYGKQAEQVSTRSPVRSRPSGAVKPRQAHARRTSQGKAVSLHSAN